MDKSELEKLNPEELISLSETNTTDFRFNRSEIYKVAFDKYTKSGETDKLDNLKREVLALDLSTHNAPEKRFDSIFTAKNEKGETWGYPNPSTDYPKESIEYYKIRAKTTKNPILKSRYSDIIWEFDKDVEFVKLAIESYLDCSEIYLKNGWDSEVADSLTRAMELAISINDSELITHTFEKHQMVVSTLISEKRFRYLVEIFEFVLERNKNYKSKINFDGIIELCEEAIKDYKENHLDSFNLQRSFLELILKVYRIQKNEQEIQKTKIRIAESYVEEAEWKKVNYPNGYFIAIDFYRLASQEYAKLGASFISKVDELQVKIQEIGSDPSKIQFEEYSVPITIPNEKVEEYFKQFNGKKPVEILQMLAFGRGFFPSYEQAKQQAIEHAKEFAFRHVVPFKLMKHGVTIKIIQGSEEKIEYDAIRGICLSYGLSSNFVLKKIFESFKKDYPDYISQIFELISSCGYLGKHRLVTIKEGLEAYQEGKYSSALHLILFQVEGILRDMLGKLGLPME